MNYIDSKYQIRINIQQIQQLIFIYEECYKIFYEINQKTQKYELFISMPNNVFMDDSEFLAFRKTKLTDIFIENLKEKHELLLKQMNVVDFDYSLKQWHEKFDVHSIKEIEMKKLPQKPVKIQDYITFNQLSKTQNQKKDY